ncbi:MAG TPA: hypothetical protein VE078_18775, partial [Thermoanaerobaculia bacterium]|nr:hypothetical protein [Thermoanaerobaculia bacterium]
MDQKRVLRGLLATLLLLAACRPAGQPVKTEAPAPRPAPISSPAPSLEFAPDLAERLAKLPKTPLDYDRTLLDERERRVVDKLIEASRLMDEVFLRQVSEENPALWRELQASAANGTPLAAEGLLLFQIHKGPWDRLAGHEPFIGKRP